jgi:hypothetical protein
MSQLALRRTFANLGPLQMAIVLLAVTTALVHLSLGVTMLSMVGHPPGHLPGPVPNHPVGRPPGRPGGASLLMLLPVPLPVLFLLNFCGYIVLAIALYLPALQRYQRIIRWILIVYAATTIVLWFLINGTHPNSLAYFDKPLEIALIILLLIDDRRALSRG